MSFWSIFNWFKTEPEDTTYSGNVFYVIDKTTGEVIREMGRGVLSATSDWGRVEEYAIQLTDKLNRQNAPCVPDWSILSFPCKNITNALNIKNDYDKVVKMIRNKKPASTLDLRIAYYAITNSLEFAPDKFTYSWMDKKWEQWVNKQSRMVNEIKYRNEIIFLGSMLTEHNIPSEADLTKLKRIFIDNKENKEILEKLLDYTLSVASKDRRIWLFKEIEPLLIDSVLNSEIQFNSIDDFLTIEPDKMKTVHVLSAELLEYTLSEEKPSRQSGIEHRSHTDKYLISVRRLLYRFHKHKGQLTDVDHIFEMEEEIETVLTNWNKRLPFIESKLQTTSKPAEIPPHVEVPRTLPDTDHHIRISIELLEKGYLLREQILKYKHDPLVTCAQLEWAATQTFFTPTSIVEDGTLVSAIIETEYFETEYGRDLQCVSIDIMSNVYQLVCLSYEIFCRRELCNTSALLEDFQKRYTSSMIKADAELRNKFAYLCLVCDTRKRRYQAVSEKVNELRRVAYEQKREDALGTMEKMITVLNQANGTSQVYQMAWNSILQFIDDWENDGIALRAFLNAMTDKKENNSIKAISEALLCHFLNCQNPDDAVSMIKSKTYDKSQLTLNDYFIISLYYLQAVGEHEWLISEINSRKEWGSVFDKLGKKRLLWAENYITEPEKLLAQKQEDLMLREKLATWAEKIILYRFCETDDIKFDHLENTFPIKSDETFTGTLLLHPDVLPSLRKRHTWTALPPEEEIEVEQAIRNISSVTPIIENLPENEEATEDEYIKTPDGKGYILNGVIVNSKKEYRIISKAFSYFVWRQEKDEQCINSFKQKLRDLKEKMVKAEICWPNSFMAIYNEIIND